MDSSEENSLPDLIIEIALKKSGEDTDYEELESVLTNYIRSNRAQAAEATSEPIVNTVDNTHESIILEGDNLNASIEQVRRLESPHRASFIQQASEASPWTPVQHLPSLESSPASLMVLRQLSSSTEQLSHRSLGPSSPEISESMQLTADITSPETAQHTLRRSERIEKIKFTRFASPCETSSKISKANPSKKYSRIMRKSRRPRKTRQESQSLHATPTRRHPEVGVFHLIRPKQTDSKSTQTDATIITKLLTNLNYQSYKLRQIP